MSRRILVALLQALILVMAGCNNRPDRVLRGVGGDYTLGENHDARRPFYIGEARAGDWGFILDCGLRIGDLIED